MKVLITFGPSAEPIDAVRHISNLSSGELGTILAETFANAGHEVLCFRGTQSTHPPPKNVNTIIPFQTNYDLLEKICSHAHEFDLILHTAALADFTPTLVIADGKPLPAGKELGKLKSHFTDIVIHFRSAIKILPKLRELFPKATICSWKYEVDGDVQIAIQEGRKQIKKYKVDSCVVNGPAIGHQFLLLSSEDNEPLAFPGKQELAEGLLLLWGEDKPQKPGYSENHQP
ncbi:MAG: hypothetical protein N2035_01195 [Chthoniobacterales bacterium]|nr:hypothetical protein [Chthoniobacterales bacterium]MCX7712274.1 hypothetical protein [Chthoniobacterales bacterium]